MAVTKKLTVGDLFEVQVSASRAKLFQYVTDDSTQLGSQVVRVLRETYDANEPSEVPRSRDYGKPEVETSRSWYVWRVGGALEDVGELTPRHQAAEIGVVVPPRSLVHRMRTGRYDFVYPGY